MLRITLPITSHSGLFVLEGRLTGLWAKELLRVARGPNQDCGNIFDLQEVFYVDSQGEEALRLLGNRGAKFIAESAYGKDLCNRLKLQRVEAGNHDPKGPDRFRNRRRTAPAGRLGAMTPADANQHPQRRAK
jgi:hypothetical protein